MRRLGVAAGALVVALVACSLYGEAGDTEVPSDAAASDANAGGGDSTSPSGDGGGIDGPLLDAGDEAPADGGTNLAENGGFETGLCAPFMFNSSKTTVAASMTARTGTYSCSLCDIGVAMGTAGIWQDFVQGAVGPGKYSVNAYVRTDGDAGNSLGQLQVTVKSTDGGIRYPTYQSSTSTTAWTSLALTVDVAADEIVAGFLVGLYSEVIGPCIVVDDVSFVKN
jgi:hypothetical protein